MQTRTFKTDDGIELVAQIAGEESAPTIVLMHGGGQTRHSWSEAVQRLADAGYRVIAYDARGHGESGWSQTGDYSCSALAADLRAITRSISNPFALIGASMGGLTAMQAIGEGMRPAALVLVDIGLRPEITGFNRIRDFMTRNPEGFISLQAAVDAVAAYNPHRSRLSSPQNLMKNLRVGKNGRLHWHWDPRIMQANASDELQRLETVVENFRRPHNVPIMLVRGQRSDVLSDETVAEFKRAFPRARVMEVPDAGHMVADSSNDVFMVGVTDYLSPYLRPGGG